MEQCIEVLASFQSLSNKIHLTNAVQPKWVSEKFLLPFYKHFPPCFIYLSPFSSCLSHSGSMQCLTDKCGATATARAAWDRQVRGVQSVTLGRAVMLHQLCTALCAQHKWVTSGALKLKHLESCWCLTQGRAQNLRVSFLRCSDLALHWLYDGFWLSDCFHVDSVWRIRC